MKPLQVVRAAYGTLLLAAPRQALRLGGSHDNAGAARTVVRVLGARHLLQAAMCATWPTPTARRVSGCTDVLHAATEVSVAVFDRRRRRAAGLDAAVAVTFAAATLVTR
jgi:hypothetical protein